MKDSMKLGLAILVFIVGTITSKAQVKYGVQAMGTFGTVSFTAEEDPGPDSKWKFGYGGGVFAEVPLTDALFLRPSLNWLKKASAMEQTYQIEGGARIEEDNRLNLNYLEVSLPVFYSIGESKTWFIGGGPSFGYGISGKVESFQSIVGQQGYTKLKAFKSQDDGGAGLKRFDFGLYASVGYRIGDLGTVQLGYLHSLSNIADTDDFNGAKINNRSVVLTLGYIIK